MCGIAGFVDPSGRLGVDELHPVAEAMAEALRHRGPDDGGVWVDVDARVALGHRRLSIIDLSSAGHQPMHSASQRYVIAFNGEVYNFGALREQLEARGHAFSGHSDTEVMVGAISEWGLVQAVNRFIGMFSFVLWDRKLRVLHLVRDRLGIKPLYYGWSGMTFLFASELKAVKQHPDFTPTINRDALALYLRHNYIPAPHSIYENVYKLPPGTILSLKDWGGADSRAVPRPYWSASEAAIEGLASPFEGSDNEAIEHLESLLRDAVKLRMVSDVPLGAFLSGGIDSSTVVALMQAQTGQPVRTYSIGSKTARYNEAGYARAVANHLGTRHTEVYVSAEDAMAVIPKLPDIYDEPFADASQIPTFLVSQLARRHVTVSLSGDGGDELFYGYNHYRNARQIWRMVGWMPVTARQTMGRLLAKIPVGALDAGLGWLSPLAKKSGFAGSIGTQLHSLSQTMVLARSQQVYLRHVSHWKEPSLLVPGSQEPPTRFTDGAGHSDLPSFSYQMMYLDAVTYLPDDILTKVDRASMSVGLEARVPMLDHRVFEFAWRLPLDMKIRSGKTKWVLRQLLSKYVPRELVDRPKKGFSVPIDEWLRGSLRDWAEQLLDERRLRHEGVLNPAPIREKWSEHLSGRRNWQTLIWSVLMFQAWLESTSMATRSSERGDSSRS